MSKPNKYDKLNQELESLLERYDATMLQDEHIDYDLYAELTDEFNEFLHKVKTCKAKKYYQFLLNFLTEKGYTVKRVFLEGKDNYWEVDGKGVSILVCDRCSFYGDWIQGKILAENTECFDKWSKAPLQIKINSDIDYDLLLENLEFLGTKEGYEFSDNYGRFSADGKEKFYG